MTSIFDKNYASSISKHFNSCSNALKPSLLFETHHPERDIRCYDWYMSIEKSSPPDWISSLTLCAKMLNDACEPTNNLDIHRAQVLTFINGPPDCSIEDSYVHHYLSPLLSSIFSSDSLLNMKWANGQLERDNPKPYQPDFWSTIFLVV